MKKISYLLASAVSALAATLPVSSIAATPDVAVRDPSAATELARPADTIRVSQAARDQIGTKARGQVQDSGADVRPGLGFGEEIPSKKPRQRVRKPGLRFGEEIPQDPLRR